MSKLLASLVVVLAAASVISAQTCSCRFNNVGTCDSISVGTITASGTTCTTSRAPCSGCVCDNAGAFTCQLFAGISWRPNGTANFCTSRNVEVAVCPTGPLPTAAPTRTPSPAPTASPAPLFYATATSCCTVDSTGSVSNTGCAINSPATYTGASGTLVSVRRFIQSNATVTTTYSGNVGDIFSTTYSIGTTFTYSSTPSLFGASIPTAFQNGAEIEAQQSGILIQTDYFSTYYNNFPLLTSGNTLFSQLVALGSGPMNYFTTIQISLSGPGGQQRVGQFTVLQCYIYNFSTTVAPGR